MRVLNPREVVEEEVLAADGEVLAAQEVGVQGVGADGEGPAVHHVGGAYAFAVRVEGEHGHVHRAAHVLGEDGGQSGIHHRDYLLHLITYILYHRFIRLSIDFM